jgi:ABC-type glycerol-3-phosphate transport system substrate-binding protein
LQDQSTAALLGGFADLGPFLGDSNVQYSNYVPFYRDVSAVFARKTLGIPLDGDVLLLYYRRDLFARYALTVPQTWDDMLGVARRMNGTDTDADGKPDLLGACFDFGCEWMR